ncbi:MAG: response regulator [Rhodospirillaceae bacterium]|jgi:CheY-like chemotaxis protein|nr:response regulator [Rhodospirillaceae bacterium]MBT5666092.1 response regulator [Rhodospirillaceae bacterium]MBT5812298.1 response regulator [Rhodospirillaceae bacterium]
MNTTLSAAGELRVLIIDDQEIMRKIIRRLLRESAITNVAEAENGLEGLEQLANPQIENPDVILCDLHMDVMSGTEFIHKLRRHKSLANPDVPVIVLTGESNDMVLDVAIQVGASAVLQKPFPPEDLRAAIEAAVGFQLG